MFASAKAGAGPRNLYLVSVMIEKLIPPFARTFPAASDDDDDD